MKTPKRNSPTATSSDTAALSPRDVRDGELFDAVQENPVGSGGKPEPVWKEWRWLKLWIPDSGEYVAEGDEFAEGRWSDPILSEFTDEFHMRWVSGDNVEELLVEYYNKGMQRQEEEIVKFSRVLGIPETDRARFVATVIAAANAARRMTGRPTAKPRAKWESRKGDDLKLSPPEFIAKHYAVEMADGTLHRGLIGQEDKPLAVKLASWLRSNPMPEGIDIPTKPEWITRQAEAGKARPEPVPRTEGQRIYDALRNRRRRESSLQT